MKFSEQQIHRYSRQMILPGIGGKGQRKLAEARLFIMGAGGLGSPAAMYLAAAGVGTVGLADFDRVELHNLQRQILHRTHDLGRLKVESGRETLESLNPEVKIRVYSERITSANIRDIIKDYNLVLDGSDNFPTRFLVNDACFFEKKTLISGAILRFDGQLSTFKPHAGGPCYRCLFPEPPPPGLVPNCAEGGVLGVLPGIIGAIQANEAIKLIIGMGESLVGRLLLFDALNMAFRQLTLRKNTECPVCGSNPTIRELADYDELCGVVSGRAPVELDVPDISAPELKREIDGGKVPFLLDVREPHEYEICNLDGHLIPLREMPDRVGELDPTRDIVVYCRIGERSAYAVDFLRKAGFRNVRNLRGGLLAWSDDVDPDFPKY